MPYAANGKVSTDPIPGGIEITPAQYAAALAGMADGKIITIDGGFAIVDPPPPPPPPPPGPEPDPDPPGMPSLSGRQIRLALRTIGITNEMVEANIAATVPDPLELDLAIIEWRNAGLYEYEHPMIAEMASAFDLPSEQVETLWIWAASL